MHKETTFYLCISTNKIRLDIRAFAIQHGMSFYDARAQEGFLRNIIVRTASTGENMLIVVFGQDRADAIELLLNHIKEQFPEIVDLAFTAHMEEQLDGVENGKDEWVGVLDAFYVGFSKTLKQAEEHLERVKVPEVESDEVCERCGRRMVIKSGRYGKFLACPGYPDCKTTKPIVEITDGLCPLCGGHVEAKKSRTNRKFYGCSNYPTCNFATWNEPTKELCPNCGKTLFRKKEKNRTLVCLTEGCGYEK